MRFIDAHNHLQDERFRDEQSALLTECATYGDILSTVNGACPQDWPLVAELARRHPCVIPNFGVHPWYINDLPTNWKEMLTGYLDATPSGVGEVGIDGWRKEFDAVKQEEIFIAQLQIAADRNLPLSVHGLRRWGRLLEILTKYPRPKRGFLLHSYGGPAEMIAAFAKLGGYFSCPGFFLNAGREMKLRVFLSVPSDRLLLETDAPDQCLAEELDRYKLRNPQDPTRRINHPANIVTIYEQFAATVGESVESLSSRIAANYSALFGDILEKRGMRLPSAS